MPKSNNAERNRGVITKRSEGKYLVRVYVGLSPAGKRIYSSKIVNGTFLQCQRELTKMLGAKDTNSFVVPSKVTVKDYLAQWLDTKVSISARTRLGYKKICELYIVPALGQVKLTKLTRAQVQTFYNSPALTPNVLQSVHAVFTQAMAFAVQEDVLVKNPCQYAERVKVERKEPTIFSAAHVQLFLERTAAIPTWGAIWRLALTTGMRPQEYLALQWEDLDVEKRTLKVRRALRENGITRGVFEVSEAMKTEKSKRVITLGQHTVDALVAHKKQSAALGGWMFVNPPTGHWFTPRDAHRHFAAATRRLNAAGAALPVMKNYNMRHTHFSHLLGNGVDVKSVQQRGGWSTATMLLEVYATSIPKVQQEMATISDNLVFPSVSKEAVR